MKMEIELVIRQSCLFFFFIVLALMGASFSSFMVSNFPLLMGMALEEERPTYIGLNYSLKAHY